MEGLEVWALCGRQNSKATPMAHALVQSPSLACGQGCEYEEISLLWLCSVNKAKEIFADVIKIPNLLSLSKGMGPSPNQVSS